MVKLEAPVRRIAKHWRHRVQPKPIVGKPPPMSEERLWGAVGRLSEVTTIDFEASCLPSFGRSFPIEVGVCDVEDGRIWSWLIRPPPLWLDWGWDPQAEDKHGISREQLLAEGVDAAIVFDYLAELGPQSRMMSDSVLDQMWLDTLAEAVGRPSPFVIENVRDAYDEVTPAGPYIGWSDVREAEVVAHRRYPTLHRAGPDAQRLAETIRLLRAVEPDFG